MLFFWGVFDISTKIYFIIRLDFTYSQVISIQMVLNFSLNKKFTDSDNILHITLLVLCLDYFYINHQLILINYAIHIFNWNFKMSGIGRSVNVTYWWHEMKKKKIEQKFMVKYVH